MGGISGGRDRLPHGNSLPDNEIEHRFDVQARRS
jgi:hypothetical protein